MELLPLSFASALYFLFFPPSLLPISAPPLPFSSSSTFSSKHRHICPAISFGLAGVWAAVPTHSVSNFLHLSQPFWGTHFVVISCPATLQSKEIAAKTQLKLYAALVGYSVFFLGSVKCFHLSVFVSPLWECGEEILGISLLYLTEGS